MLKTGKTKLVIAGGHPRFRGGVEVFIERNKACLEEHARYDIRIQHTYSSFLRPQRLHLYLIAFCRLASARFDGFKTVWLQYVSFPDLLFIPFCRLLGYNVVVTPHLGGSWVSLRFTFLSNLSRLLLSLANRIALLSKSQSTELRLPNENRHVFIRTMLPQMKMRPSRPFSSVQLKLAHIARLSDSKGTLDFLKVCHQLNVIGYDFRATIIGSCDVKYYTKIEHFLDVNDLCERVSVYNWMPQRDVLDKLTKTDVLVHLSRVDSFPLIVLEAIRCGAFPICLNLPGAATITTEYCGLVIEGADIVAATVELLVSCNANAWRERARFASGRIELDYEWENCAILLQKALSDSSPTEMKVAMGIARSGGLEN